VNKIGKNFRDIRYIDTMALGNSPLHLLDPRAKLITTIFFIVAVVSFDRYTLIRFVPFFLYPIVLISAGGLPAGFFLKKVMLVAPFAIVIGIFNPLIDREIVSYMGPIAISGGWISFFSILLRFFLTVSSVLILISLTGFNTVCHALIGLGVPRVFVIQLLFFYRYIFVLMDEAEKMEMARSLRSFNEKSRPLRVFVSIIGHLLLRSYDRAERIYLAMQCRGFDGNIRLTRALKLNLKDLAFITCWSLVFIIFRFDNISVRMGELVMEVIK
jgi:cobalt/nickel transport system permease protein